MIEKITFLLWILGCIFTVLGGFFSICFMASFLVETPQKNKAVLMVAAFKFLFYAFLAYGLMWVLK